LKAALIFTSPPPLQCGYTGNIMDAVHSIELGSGWRRAWTSFTATLSLGHVVPSFAPYLGFGSLGYGDWVIGLCSLWLLFGHMSHCLGHDKGVRKMK